MGDITWTRIDTFTPTSGGCGVSGIACIGSHRMLAFYEEIDEQRVFRSSADGQEGSWAQLTTVVSDSLWDNHPGRMLTLGAGQVLVVGGPQGFVDDTDTTGMVPYTPDSGETWEHPTSALAGPGGVSFQSRGSVVLDAGEVWVTGTFLPDPFTTEYAYLRALTAPTGWMFGHATLIADVGAQNLWDGVYLGGDVVVIGLGLGSGVLPGVVRSVDRGVTWAAVSMPSAVAMANILGSDVITVATNTDGTVIIAGGGLFISPSFTQTPGLWRSVDGGLTFTNIISALPSLVATSANVNHILYLGGDRFVLCIEGNNVTASAAKNWYLTEDDGVTWAACTVTNTSAANETLVPNQMALAEDGAIVAVGFIDAAGANEHLEFWRGVPSGFTVTSPCGETVLSGAVELSVHQECVSAFLPAPCPQPCGDEA